MLMLGDCLQKMQEIPESSVDLILTDPPYGTTDCSWDSIIPFEPMWEQIWRVLKPNGVCLLFSSQPFTSVLNCSQLNYYRYEWTWIKSRTTGFQMASKRPMKQHENISCFYRKTPTFNLNLVDIDTPKKSYNDVKRGSLLGKKSFNSSIEYSQTKTGFYVDILPFNNEHNVGIMVHPTQKPVALLAYLIQIYTNEGETVLDFTMGSGSTGVAAVELKRKFIGIENDEKYLEIAKHRLDPRYVNSEFLHAISSSKIEFEDVDFG
jgi:DNA modification methylase